ncbi:hypothetical protein DIS24_g8647 [Lasiodiplodia hormozganensis]|uniref:Uncharacterized protein n=1 Tax=Lasiodiplodia hormozganensis TaxID=869390 RepID=A0AA39Y0V4_9PEZI|nr:hypothetical protein DIS24_g8647 [Lasiodiplodia hormozganensis]
MDSGGKVKVKAGVVFTTLVRAARHKPKNVDFDIKSLSDQLMPLAWDIRIPEAEITIPRDDFDKINAIIAALEMPANQDKKVTKEISDQRKEEYSKVADRLNGVPDSLEAFAGAVEGQELEPPKPSETPRTSFNSDADTSQRSTAKNNAVINGSPQANFWDYGEGDYFVLEPIQLSFILEIAHTYPKLKDQADYIQKAQIEKPDEPGLVFIPAGEPKDTVYRILAQLLPDHPEIAKKTPDWDDEHAWGIDDSPYGYPVEEGEYAQLQSYLTWKAKYNGKATFDQFKEYVKDAREKPYRRPEYEFSD